MVKMKSFWLHEKRHTSIPDLRVQHNEAVLMLEAVEDSHDGTGFYYIIIGHQPAVCTSRDANCMAIIPIDASLDR
jgi:hypothetical protein